MKKFLGTFLFMVAMLSFIIIVIDFAEKSSDFIEYQPPFSEIIFSYLLNFLPGLLNLIMPLLVFISVIYFTGRMAARAEIIAIQNSGASLWRIARPYILVGTLLMLTSFLLNLEFIPRCERDKMAFQETWLSKKHGTLSSNLHRQIGPDLYLSIESFVFDDSVGYRFTLEKMAGQRMITKLEASRISWNAKRKSWKLENYLRRDYLEQREHLYSGMMIDTILPFGPGELQVDNALAPTMGLSDLTQRIEKEKLKGSENVAYFQIEKYKRFSNPFCILVLSLLGLSVSSRKMRGGMGIQLMVGIALSFAYIVLMRFAEQFAANDLVPAALAIWSPNILFLIITSVIFYGAWRHRPILGMQF